MLDVIHQHKLDGQIIGFTASTFDCLHAGHIVMLNEARARCDYLVVGLLTDPTIDRPTTKNKPVQTIFERWIQVSAVSSVDYIIPFETERDLSDMLHVLKPDIRVVGEEYRNVDFTGKDIPGIELFYNPRTHSFSTSELRSRIVNAGNVLPTAVHPTKPKD